MRVSLSSKTPPSFVGSLLAGREKNENIWISLVLNSHEKNTVDEEGREDKTRKQERRRGYDATEREEENPRKRTEGKSHPYSLCRFVSFSKSELVKVVEDIL